MTILEFHIDGSFARRWHKNPDGSEWTTSYEYDSARRLKALRTENTDGIVNLQLYEYDAAGRLARVISRPKDGDDCTAESYEYDAAGRKKKTFYVDLASERADTLYAFGVEGTDSGYSAPGAATLTTLYNERDQPTHLIFYDKTGRVLSRVEFGYDETGRLVEEAQTKVEETLPPEMLTSLNQPQLETLRALFGAGGEPIRRLHRYNEQGLRAETRSRMDPLGGDCKTMAYNAHGDQIEEVFEHDERDYNMDEEGRLSDSPTSQSVSRSEARFLYDYDAQSNWVMKTIEGRGAADQDFTLSSVERRTLAYFG